MLRAMGLGAALAGFVGENMPLADTWGSALYTGRARKCQVLSKLIYIVQRLSRAASRKCQHTLHGSEDLWACPWEGFFPILHSLPSALQPPPNTEQHRNRLSQQWTWAESYRAAVALQHWWINPVKSSWFRISAGVFQKGWAIWVSSTANERCSNWGIKRKKGNYAAE